MTTEAPEVLDVEHRLICRVLTEPDEWLAVVNAAITADFFQNAKHRRVWDRITEFYGEYHEIPTVAVLRQDFPKETYRFVKVHEPIDYLIDEIRTSRKAALLERGLDDAASAWEAGDYDGSLTAINEVSAMVRQAVPIAEDVDLTKTGDERLSAYLTQMPADGMIGIPTGYKHIDKVTGGLQSEQLISLAGFAKNGKSFVLLDWARAAHLAGFEPLVLGFEMSNDEQAERVDASRAGISFTRLRNRNLTDADKEKLARAIKDLSTMPNAFNFSADRSRMMTISGVEAKIQEYRPPVVYVDGAYMLDDENGEPRMSPRALTNITSGFKRLAQTYKIPIVITTQGLENKVQRTAKKGSSRRMSRGTVGYSTSFLNDSDHLFGVEVSEEDPNIQILSLLASRTCSPTDFFIERNWDLGYFQELDYNPFESDGGYNEDDDDSF